MERSWALREAMHEEKQHAISSIVISQHSVAFGVM